MKDEWQERLARLTDEELDSLKREKELGELNFSESVEKLRVIRRLVEAFGQEDPNEVPTQIFNQVTGQLDQVISFAEQMKTFTLAQDQAASQHNNIDTQVENLREWFVQQVRPHIRGMAVDSSSMSSEAKTALSQAKSGATEIEEILTRLRTLSGEAGASQMSGYYQRQGETHGRQAGRFLTWAVVALAVTLALGVFLFVVNPLPVDLEAPTGTLWAEFVRGLVVRVLFLGAATYVLSFLLRNYRINKHLQVANEQRRNALNTYVLWIDTAANDETRNIITAELARAVFGATDTGFLTAGHDETIVENQPSLLGLLAGRQGPTPS